VSGTPVTTSPAPVVAATTRDKPLAVARRAAVRGRERVALWVDHSLPRAFARVRSTGPMGLGGIGLLAFALIFTWTVLLPQRENLASLRETLEASRVGDSTVAASAAPSRQASDFMAKLPRRSDLPALVGVILQQADERGLRLDTGTYEWRAGKGGDVGQYRITLPVQGGYPRIREFVEATLAAAPGLGLESLHLARESVGDGVVEAEISFVVFVRGT
jgi:hypothetical protein